ncbi:hypothetical protein DT075_39465 [Bacillus licheniformis]|nr:hypothetical protein DT075_39465 [Bacillus licheniformis]
MNAIPSARWSGAQSFYYGQYEENERAAKFIQDELRHNLENTTRKAKRIHGIYLMQNVKKPGAVLEKDVALEVSLRIRDYLQEQGALVMLTREDDHDLAPEETRGLSRRKAEDLRKRVDMINNSEADLYGAGGKGMKKKIKWLGFLLGFVVLLCLFQYQFNNDDSWRSWNLPLSGKIIYIDPGHGGADGGASSGEGGF